MKDIKVIIDDGDQKAIIFIKDMGNGTHKIHAEFQPAVDTKKDNVSPVAGITMNFLKFLKG